MLVLTENAATVIRQIAARPDFPDGGGLRLSAPMDGSRSLSVSAAPGPHEGDEVVENEGARVFLETTAATMLDDQVLDARVGDEGTVQFLIAPQ